MFLIPACGAILADSVIIYLHAKYHSLLQEVVVKVTFCVENTSYFEPLSILRLVLLLPLIYRNISGTRLNLPLVYSTLHIISGLLVSTHLIVLTIMFHNGSSRNDWPPTKYSSDAPKEGGEETIIIPVNQHDDFDDFGVPSPVLLMGNMEIMGNDLFILWYTVTRVLLALSIVSITLHATILLHLRSSAPSSGDFRQKVVGKDKRKRKLLAYWVYDKYRRKTHDGGLVDGYGNLEHIDDSEHVNGSQIFEGYLLESPRSSSQRVADKGYESAFSNDDGTDTSGGYESAFSNVQDMNTSHTDETEPFLSLGNEKKAAFEDGSVLESVQDADTTARKRKRGNLGHGASWNHNHGVTFRNLAGFQACFTDGYDEFMSEIRTHFQEAKREWGARLDEVSDRVQQQTGTGNFLSQLNQQTPFQALLHLYAHEEVLTNHKLDRAFSNTEDNLALSFYAPQLLVFLLHNAYLNTGRLEIWLLDKCRTNIQFAHRCFWFLRAWCLQDGVNKLEDDGSEVSSQGSHQFGPDQINLSKKRTYSGGSLSAMIENWGKKEHEVDHDRSIADVKTATNVSSGLVLDHSNTKLKSEERQSLEELLLKVMECGEDAARKLEYGHSDDGGNWEMPPMESSPLQEDGVASVTSAGLCPSIGHLNAAKAKYTYGFQPLPHPDTRLEPIIANGHANFLRTPDFLDELIRIADDLMEQPQTCRTTELRQRLKQLEVDFLPSNSIYVPINDSMHRVWRIVASESIALSTKERVPCIVCLEVVDYSTSKDLLNARNSNKMNGALSERALLTDWYKSPRPAQRHNTLLAKVSSITKRGLQKLRHDIEDSIQNQDAPSSDTGLTADHFSHVTSNMPLSLLHEMDNNEVTHSTTQVKKSLQIDRNDIENQQLNVLPAGLPIHEAELQQSLNNLLAEKDLPSSTAKLGQWLSATQLGPVGQDQVRDDSKADDSSIAELSLPELPLETNGTGSASTVDNSRNEQSFYKDYKSTLASKPKKKKVKKHKRRSSGSSIQTTSSTITTRSPPVVFKEDWQTKEKRLRSKSAYGSHPNWRLLPILIKSNDDLRQEQLAAQLIHCMASILAQAKVPVWLYPYEIVALTFRGGIIEAIPDTISIDSLRKNHPNFTDLKAFVEQHFGPAGCDEYENAKANFVESLAAYSIVCFLLQVKDRHNGNILLDNKGHLIHIDFGFFFLSSPGKNSGFESAPFKLTREFVEMMDGANSRTFIKFRELCYKTFLELRKNCFKITLLVQMLIEGNEDLDCFRNQPHDAVQGLQERFRLDLNDRACLEYVNSLIDISLENWTTTCYDRYQRCCVGVM